MASKRPFFALLVTLFLLAVGTLARAVAAAPAPFADGERVLFLGDSITRGGGWHSLISLFYETRFPERRITWLNAGISGDTAAGAVKRLQWDVLDRKPSTVVMMFGINDVARPDLPGEIGSDARVAQFGQSLRELVGGLRSASVRIVLCTPSPYDATVQSTAEAKPAANTALTRCAALCRELAADLDLPLVDFNGPMNAMTADFQKTNPAFTLIGGDRVHPGNLGNTVMAYLFLKAQGVAGTVSEMVIDAATGKLTSAANAAVTELTATAGEVAFTAQENALPLPFEGEAREALHLVPFAAELNRQILTVTGLEKGEYELRIDDQPVGRWWHDDLAAGVNLAQVRATPQYQQAKQVSDAHARRHQLASWAPRMIAFTRLYTLLPAGVVEADEAAVKALLEKLIVDPAAKDNPDLGFDGYGQGMAKKYLELKPKEAETEAAIAAADDELYRLNRPLPHRYQVRRVAHPLTIEQRQAALAARRNPEQVEKTAREFLNLLILDGPGLLRSNLRLRKGLQAVADLAKAGKPGEALAAYRDYFFDKLRNPAAFGLPPGLTDPYRSLVKPAERAKALAQAAELIQGKLVADAAPMPPGAVWLPRPKEGSTGAANPWTPGTFQPLAVAYLLTGERPYLDKWIDYLDDWAMHENTDNAIRATDISDSDSHAVSQVLGVYQLFGGIARLQPPAKTEFPADSLARVLGRLIRVCPPLSIVYHDTNPQNWTPGATAGLMKVVALMDEFRAAEYIFRRARQRHENYGTIQFLPDGGETEHALWYNCHYFDGAWDAMELAAARRELPAYQRPAWEDGMCAPAWEAEQRRKLSDRSRYFLQMLTPQSQYPIGNRSDQRTLPDWKSAAMVEYAILNGAPDLQVLLNALRNNFAAGLPEFTLSAFPCSGSWLVRTGWGKDAGYAHFFCSPFPVGGHAFPGLKSNNSFYLSAAGQDLLVSGGFGSYSYDRSPLRVDGKEPFALAGIGNPGINKNHKGFGVAYIDPQPAPWRSHSSARFDFAEGVYAGPYGDFVEDHHDNKDYRVDFLAERARAVFTGVSHQRQVFFVKDPGLWIIVDRLRSPQPREYTLDWRLPTAPVPAAEGKRMGKYAGKTFAPEAIGVDAAGQTVTTTAADSPNLVIRHVGPPLAFSTAREDTSVIANDYTGHYAMYDFWRVSGSWRSAGNDVVISLVEVVLPGAQSRIRQLESVGDGVTARGFTAVTADGNTIAFQVGVTASAELAAGNVALTGEALLVSGDHGIVLGCTTFQGKESAATDFEFSLNPESGTPNTEHPTLNAERSSLNPEPQTLAPQAGTSNVQRSTSNAQRHTEHRTPNTGSSDKAYDKAYDKVAPLHLPPSTLHPVPIFRPIAPVRIEPGRNVIGGDEPITLTCATPGVDLRYTLDGSDPTPQSPLYAGPFTLTGSVTVKARAFRPGVERVPGSLAGTHATVTTVARYTRQEPQASVAAADEKRYTPGLKADYYEGDWKDLVFFPEQLKALKTQNVRHLFDRCVPSGDKVFGWTYSGFLAVPEDGVYTFHAPEEMVTSPREPGYALRLFVGQEMLANNRPSGNLNEWYPATTRHGYGTWSVALKKGLHPFKAMYVDYRTDAVARLNHPGLRLNTIWDGTVPELRISGAGLRAQPIPAEWYRRGP